MLIERWQRHDNTVQSYGSPGQRLPGPEVIWPDPNVPTCAFHRLQLEQFKPHELLS